MASMNGKVVLVTGATDGIGRQTALKLARLGASVVVHGRSAKKAEAAAAEVRAAVGEGAVHTAVADLASMAEVRRMADDVVRRFDRLDVLVNNAGVFMHERRLTEDGLETTFAVNHLAPFLLTLLLLDLLKASAPSRVVTVSSMVHIRAHPAFDNLQGETRFRGGYAYNLSKLGNVLFTFELAERLAGTGVTVNCLHPGVVATRLLRTGWHVRGGISTERGAETSVFLASSPEVENVTGKFFSNRHVTEPSPLAYDRSLRQRFWVESAWLAGLE